jgi:hypothetical protein
VAAVTGGDQGSVKQGRERKDLKMEPKNGHPAKLIQLVIADVDGTLVTQKK